MVKYKVWCTDLGQTEDDARDIEAGYPSNAAELWSMREDAHSADYWIVSVQDANVFVKDESGKVYHYIVCGESIPSYYARLVTKRD